MKHLENCFHALTCLGFTQVGDTFKFERELHTSLDADALHAACDHLQGSKWAAVVLIHKSAATGPTVGGHNYGSTVSGVEIRRARAD